MLTTSSRASIESNPRPFGPKSGRSSPIWSGVVCSIKFLTSISLMRTRRSTTDIISGGEVVVIGPGGQLRFVRSEEHTSELQSLRHLVCRLLLEKKKKNKP